MDYQVDLDTFRGPLDLLLYLVKRSEIDVCDIPIARVAEQFLEYLRLLDELIDVEHAGDFLVMAATLMEIKSKMLLPRAEAITDVEADPRAELVKQLMEYRRYKDAAALLDAQAEKQSTRLPRQPIASLAAAEPSQQPLAEVELWDLVSAFGRLMRETLASQSQQIVVDQTPIGVYMGRILQQLQQQPCLPFSALFASLASQDEKVTAQRSRLVGIFLALLELIKSSRVEANQPEAFGEIELHLKQ